MDGPIPAANSVKPAVNPAVNSASLSFRPSAVAKRESDARDANSRNAVSPFQLRPSLQCRYIQPLDVGYKRDNAE